jgi:hypothetical protein
MAKVGRPTDYKPEYCEQIIEYFSVKPYAKETKPVQTPMGTIPMPIDAASDFPSFAGFAAKIGVCRDTLLDWCTAHDEFLRAYKKAKELQENWLVTNGMKGLVSTPFAIFTAKNVIGWRDRNETTVKEHDPAKIPDADIDARLEQLLSKHKPTAKKAKTKNKKGIS